MIGDDAAVSSVLDFVVAMGVFVVLLGLFFTFSPLGSRSEPSLSGQATAQAIADALVDRPGLGEGVGTDWSVAPENVTVLGLRDGTADRLAFAKVAALAHGRLEADPVNGAVDYPDTRQALGLDRFEVGYQMRLKIRPDPGADEATWRTDQLDGVRVAYLGRAGDETGWIDDTALLFDPDRDLYADTTSGVDELVGELPRYGVLVVGSGADHTPLDRPGVETRLETWVDAGGGVVALGSPDATDGWLDGMLETPSVGPASAPLVEADASANVATNPYDLRVLDHDPLPDGAGNATWSTGSPVTRVVVPADAPDRFTLGHAFHGNGTLVLTTVRPTAVADDLGEMEARRLISNLLTVAATGPVNLDHGLPPVQEARAWTADRTTVVAHPRAGAVRARLAVTLWTG